MFTELYDLSSGRDFGLSPADFAQALLAISRRYLPATANQREMVQFCRTLHLRDLALAQACSRGSALAWERFAELYQGKLYAAAMVVAKQEAIARELAGSLFGDLFDLGAENKLASYSGRGSLEGWLKAILARAYVDGYRSRRKLVSLDDCLAAIGMASLSSPDLAAQYGSERAGAAFLPEAVAEAIRGRTPEQRFLLAAYFFDGWTLAEIGARLDVHESTVSRKIDRVLREIRRSISRNLQKRGMSARQIEESMRVDVQELPLEIHGLLLRESGNQP